MRILVLTLYYAPLNNIASTRITYFSEALRKNGHDVHVITRHYSEVEMLRSNLSIGLTNTPDLNIPYYKTDNVIYTRFDKKNAKTKFGKILPRGFRGYYFSKQLDAFHYSFVENGLIAFEQEFSNSKFDLILASSPPVSVLLLANKIGKKYNIPWIADFRDSPVLDENVGLIRKIRIKKINQLISGSNGVLFVSPGMKDLNLGFYNQKNQNLKHTVIYNGFVEPKEAIKPDVLDHFKQIKLNHKLTLVYTGSIYKQRNLDFFLDELKQINRNDIALVMVGIQDSYRNSISKEYSELNLYFIDKVNYATSIQIQRLADALLLTIWKNSYTGFSGKVFEYIHARTHILLDHSPARDLKNFLKPFPNIHYADSDSRRFNQIIEKIESEKPKSTEAKLLEEFTRLNQTKKLELFLRNSLTKN